MSNLTCVLIYSRQNVLLKMCLKDSSVLQIMWNLQKNIHDDFTVKEITVFRVSTFFEQSVTNSTNQDCEILFQ